MPFFRDKDPNSPGLHYPGDSYLGPGTDVVGKILSNVGAKSPNDYVAMQHDIDYLSGREPIISDINAILRANNSPDGLALKLGLGSRVVADILAGPFHKVTHFNKEAGLSKEEVHQLEMISGSSAWNPGFWHPAIGNTKSDEKTKKTKPFKPMWDQPTNWKASPNWVGIGKW